jgi:three-Cys-motif partner protein
MVPGSPMILLQEVAYARARLNIQRRKPFHRNAQFIFVERSTANKKFLEHTIRQSEYKSLLGNSVHLLNTEFEQALPQILARIRARTRAHRSIFFLDQYVYSQVSLETIRTILTSLNSPEIILTFNVDWLTHDCDVVASAMASAQCCSVSNWSNDEAAEKGVLVAHLIEASIRRQRAKL